MTCKFTPNMPFARDQRSGPPNAANIRSSDRFLECAQECERLALSERVSPRIAAVARECSHFCYMAAALQGAEAEHSSYFIYRSCMDHCAGLANACASMGGAAQCARLCCECEALCHERCGRAGL